VAPPTDPAHGITDTRRRREKPPACRQDAIGGEAEGGHAPSWQRRYGAGPRAQRERSLVKSWRRSTTWWEPGPRRLPRFGSAKASRRSLSRPHPVSTTARELFRQPFTAAARPGRFRRSLSSSMPPLFCFSDTEKSEDRHVFSLLVRDHSTSSLMCQDYWHLRHGE
jgi:hypothetical protein